MVVRRLHGLEGGGEQKHGRPALVVEGRHSTWLAFSLGDRESWAEYPPVIQGVKTDPMGSG